MKLWASASLIGLSTAYVLAGCSSNPDDGNGYVPPATAGNTGVSGAAPGASGAGTAGTPTTAGAPPAAGGTPMTAGAGGVGTAGVGTAGGGMGGGTAGTGGTTPGGEVPAACPAGVLGHCTMGTDYPKYPGFTLALVEDFAAPIDLDKDPIWTWSDGSPESGQTSFRKEQLTFANGKMTITAEPPAGCAPKNTNPECITPRSSYGEAKDPNAQAPVPAMGVYSGELRTKYNNYRYGRYEAKFQAPLGSPAQATMSNQAGFLSTMFIFRTPKNVVWNEIDVELEPNIFNAYQGNVVYAKNAGGYPAGNAHPIMPLGPTGYHIAQEHVYAFNWMPDKVEWFLDGKSIEMWAGSANVPIPNLSAKIMMNMWIFGDDHFGPSAKNMYPLKAVYDYFRFYKADTGEAKYPCAPTPACLDAADKTKSSQNNPSEMAYGQ